MNTDLMNKTRIRSTAKWVLCLAALFSVLAAPQVLAQKEPLVFDTPEQEERYQQLTLELRCVVCQNQNLADSDAPLAQDLRQEIYDMMQEGNNNEEIKTFLVERYGDFVLYRPAMSGNTLALWLIPMVLLGLGALGVMFSIRSRNRKLAQRDAGGEA